MRNRGRVTALVWPGLVSTNENAESWATETKPIMAGNEGQEEGCIRGLSCRDLLAVLSGTAGSTGDSPPAEGPAGLCDRRESHNHCCCQQPHLLRTQHRAGCQGPTEDSLTDITAGGRVPGSY